MSMKIFRSSRVRLALRGLGAILLIFVGADHYYEYTVDQYSTIPTIGTLFLLNFISASALGLILLAPLERLLRRFGAAASVAAAAPAAVALSGFGVAATSLAALLTSEQTKLFGFMEFNYRPAIIVAIASEAAAAICLALFVVLTLAARRSTTGDEPPSGDRSRLRLVTAPREASAESGAGN